MNGVYGKPAAHANLDAFLKARYRFAVKAIAPASRVLGIGAGCGMSRYYLPGVTLVDTDVVSAPWLDAVCDGGDLPFSDASFDAVVAMAVLHHLPHPRRGIEELARVVRGGGRVCIQEPHVSLALRALLAAFRHEYIDASVDPFGDETCLPRRDSPMDGNNAVGDLLFNDRNRFARDFPQFRVIHHCYRHCFLYANSGSLSGEHFHVPLPRAALGVIERLDNGLCRIAPSVFATCQEIVLERV